MALSSNALCVLGGAGYGLKDELGITGTSEDARLERLIEVASGAIANYCGVPSFHYESARVEDHRGYGTPILHVNKRPLLSIGSVYYDPLDANTEIDSDDYLLDSEAEGRIYRPGGWLWTAAELSNIGTTPLPGTEQSMYRVTFACGYRTRNQVQATLDGALDGATETAVVVNETIPTDTPQTGSIRIMLDSGVWREVDYTSWTSKTFTIGSTDFADPLDAADGNAVEITSVMTLPTDIEDAAIMLASMRYRWGPRNPSVTSEKLLGWSASYGESGGLIPDEVAGLLAGYSRPVWA